MGDNQITQKNKLTIFKQILDGAFQIERFNECSVLQCLSVTNTAHINALSVTANGQLGMLANALNKREREIEGTYSEGSNKNSTRSMISVITDRAGPYCFNR